MNYSELSLDKLKEIAKEKGISVGNTGKEKLIEKIEKYDLENSTKSLIDGTDIENDITVTDEDITENKADEKEEIYSKELSKNNTKNKVIRKDTLTVGMGSAQIDIGILHDDELFSVSPAYHTFNIIQNDSRFIESSFEKNNEKYSRQHMIVGARQGKSVDFQGFLNDIIHLPIYMAMFL